MEYKNLIIDREDSTVIITLNKPKKLNALDIDVIRELGSAMNEFSEDKSCRSIIISGNEGAFSTGMDINYLMDLDGADEVELFFDKIHFFFNLIEDFKKPVIAAIDGYCLGGGLELALACDIRIASPKSRFGIPEVKLGIIPGGGATYRLPKIVGITKAKEMIFTGKIIDADEALRINLINKIAEKDTNVKKEAIEIAKTLNTNSLNAIMYAKQAMNNYIKVSNEFEKTGFLFCFSNQDSKEGLKSFIEKRKPKFTN
ncbi:enoyl-CoA hydratase/isomerase family protein [Candidatus Marsarchaeota archaeon]|nr:enoyl-CoA hydratase/isomerase family protein [Candidatus Marsarchaeota archaeon]